MDAAVFQFNLPSQAAAGGVLAPQAGLAATLPGQAAGAVDLFAALLGQQLGRGLTVLPQGSELAPEMTQEVAQIDPLLQLQQMAMAVQNGVLTPLQPTREAADALSEAAPADAPDATDPALLVAAPVTAAQPMLAPIPLQPAAAQGVSSELKPAPAAAVVRAVEVRSAVGAGDESTAAVTASARQPVAGPPAAFAAAEHVGGEAKAEVELPVVAAPSPSDFARALQSASAAPLASAQPQLQLQLQPAATQSAAPQPVATIPQTVGQSAWGETLGERVVWMVGQQHQNVELHLNPPALGPLEVRLNISEGQATLNFSTHHLPVKEEIEAATPRLREMLGESGISLGSVSVNVGTFSQPQSGQTAQSDTPSRPWAHPPVEGETVPVLVGTTRLLRGNGMVDTFV